MVFEVRRIINKVAEAVRDAVRSFKTAGLLRTLQRAFDRGMPSNIFRFNQIVAVEAPIAAVLETWQGEPPNDRYEHRWSTGADVVSLTCGGLSSEKIRKYLNADGCVVITTLDGEVAGYAWWISKSWTSEGWLRVTPATGELWAEHAYTVPEHRGKRIQRQIRKFAYPQLIAQGCERVLGFVDVLNRSSLQAGSTPARKYVGRVLYVRVFGLVFYRIDRKWGAGVWNEARPYDLNFDVFDRDGPSRSPKAAFSKYNGPRNT